MERQLRYFETELEDLNNDASAEGMPPLVIEKPEVDINSSRANFDDLEVRLLAIPQTPTFFSLLLVNILI